MCHTLANFDDRSISRANRIRAEGAKALAPAIRDSDALSWMVGTRAFAPFVADLVIVEGKRLQRPERPTGSCVCQHGHVPMSNFLVTER